MHTHTHDRQNHPFRQEEKIECWLAIGPDNFREVLKKIAPFPIKQTKRRRPLGLLMLVYVGIFRDRRNKNVVCLGLLFT